MMNPQDGMTGMSPISAPISAPTSPPQSGQMPMPQYLQSQPQPPYQVYQQPHPIQSMANPVYSMPPAPYQGQTVPSAHYSASPYPAQPQAQIYPLKPMPTPQVNPFFGETSVMITCTHCGKKGYTELTHELGGCTWLACALCFFCLLWPCFLFPFCMDSFQDVHHHCSHCKRIAGVYKRL